MTLFPPIENPYQNSNLNESTLSDIKSIVTHGSLSIAQIPLGRTSRQDQERQDLKKEFHLNEQQEKEIEARNNDIKRLEESIKDLHDLFMRMKDLTQSQVRLFLRIVHKHVISFFKSMPEGVGSDI